MCKRFNACNSAGAAIASAVLKDFEVIGDVNLAEVIDYRPGVLNRGKFTPWGGGKFSELKTKENVNFQY